MHNMGNILLSGIVAFIITFLVIPIVIKVARLKKLYDVPDERKIHSTPIPSLGGVGIFIGFILALLLFADGSLPPIALESYIAGFVVIFFVGIKDDILNISPIKKLGGQLLVSVILMFKSNLLITNMHGFLGVHEIHQSVSYFLTLVTIVVTMNAYNLIDGVDGLAGTISIVTCSALGFFFLTSNDLLYSLMAFSFAGSLVAFLIYNFSHTNKIFMGDTGSMLSGTLNVILVIHFISTPISSTMLTVSAAPAVGFGVLMLPLLDTLRVFGIRMFKGKSPFSSDRNHLHHLLLDRGMTHVQITMTLATLAVVGIVISYFAQPMGTTILIIMQLCLFFSGVYILHFLRNRNKPVEAIDELEVGEELDESKPVIKSIFSFNKENTSTDNVRIADK